MILLVAFIWFSSLIWFFLMISICVEAKWIPSMLKITEWVKMVEVTSYLLYSLVQPFHVLYAKISNKIYLESLRHTRSPYAGLVNVSFYFNLISAYCVCVSNVLHSHEYWVHYACIVHVRTGFSRVLIIWSALFQFHGN